MTFSPHLFDYCKEIYLKKNLWPNEHVQVEKLLQALFDDDEKTFKEIVDSGLDVQILGDNRGFSFLHLAILTGNCEILDILLQQPTVNVNAPYNYETPLCFALKYHCPENIILKLLEAGADAANTDREDKSTLHLAANLGSPAVCEQLIKSGVDLNSTSFDRFTPLHEAVFSSHPMVVQVLLFYGADPSCRNWEGRTPFMQSLADSNISSEFLEYEADFNVISNDDRQYSLLLMALEKNNPIASELIRRDADVNYISPDGCYALELALRWQDPKVYREIWAKMDKNLVPKAFHSFLKLYISWYCCFETEDWLACLYDLLDSEIACDTIDAFVNQVERPFLQIVSQLHKRSVSKDDRVKLIYIFLSFSVPIVMSDIFYIYEKYGLDKEIEACFFVEIDDYNSIPIANKFIVPSLLLHVNRDVNNIMLKTICSYFTDFQFNKFLEEILFVFQFCTPTQQFKDEYDRKMFLEVEQVNGNQFNGWFAVGKTKIKQLHRTVLQKFRENRVPLLLELSRNAFRNFIVKRLDLKNISQLQAALTACNIPKRIRDIVMFKEPLYRY